MKFSLILVGKTTGKPLIQMIDDYVERIAHFAPLSVEVIPELRNAKSLSREQQKAQEGKALLAKIKPSDRVVLLDERGKMFSSQDFATYIEKMQHCGAGRTVFIIGGPYGFSPEVYSRADDKISLSPMTFSHQMVRLLFVEQFYRAHTILHNLPYHHE